MIKLTTFYPDKSLKTGYFDTFEDAEVEADKIAERHFEKRAFPADWTYSRGNYSRSFDDEFEQYITDISESEAFNDGGASCFDLAEEPEPETSDDQSNVLEYEPKKSYQDNKALLDLLGEQGYDLGTALSLFYAAGEVLNAEAEEELLGLAKAHLDRLKNL